MANFGIGVKAFIVDNEKFLFIRRRADDPHNAGKWDQPGGRLNPGEDVIDGIKREVKEETNLDIEVILPLEAHSFTRQDGQHITLINFLCKKLSGEIKLSEEHTEYKWVDMNESDMPDWVLPPIENYRKYIKV